MTAILYLNPEDWDAQTDGGQLRCFLDAEATDETGEQASHIDIEPKLGRLVLFWSRRMLHEVRPATRTRSALSLWILGNTDATE